MNECQFLDPKIHVPVRMDELRPDCVNGCGKAMYYCNDHGKNFCTNCIVDHEKLSRPKTLFFNGRTKVIEVNGKQMIERVPASAILAIDNNNNVIMVEQDRGSFGKMLEVPAGKVEQGEDPFETALRELEEETGYRGLNCTKLISYYPSVGYTTEEIHCYITNKLTLGHQRLDDGEKVTVKLIPFKQLVEMVNTGEIKDSKTIMCVLAYNATRLICGECKKDKCDYCESIHCDCDHK